MDITFDAGIGYFLWSVFLGIILAFIYDIIRVTRRVKKTPDGAVNFEDILYVIVSGCLLLYAAFNKNNGQLRWHGFLGTFSGILLYYIILGNHMVNITVAVWECLLKIVLWIVKIALYPVKLIYKILEKTFQYNVLAYG